MSQGVPKSMKNQYQDGVKIDLQLEINFRAVLGANLEQNGSQDASENGWCCVRICALLTKLWNSAATQLEPSCNSAATQLELIGTRTRSDQKTIEPTRQ